MNIIQLPNNKKFIFIIICFFIQIFAYAQTQKGSDIDGEAMENRSGWSVSMPDANTVAIGAYENDGTGRDAGHVRVYRWSGSSWVQKGSDIDGEAAYDYSGYSVSMPDANTVAIGAPYNNGGTASNAGHVRVYSWSGSSWVQKGSEIDGEAADDESGYSVSMPDANTVAIGATWNDGTGRDAGHVRVYRWSGSSWVQKGSDIDGEAADDYSGGSVSMPDANTVAIGAPGNNDTTGRYDAGHVRVYRWSGSSWVQKGSDIDGEAGYDESGWSVSMPDANTVAIGAPYNNGGTGLDAGHVRVYSWSGSSWVQKGSDIDGEADDDWSGWSVSMPDSNTVAIGAIFNDGTGRDAGHVKVYRWSGSAWVRKGSDIDGEAADDISGNSVSMPDANTVAIGAPRNGDYAGHVRVYRLCENITDTIAIISCNSYVSPSGNYTYTQSGTYYDTIPNTNGCDSVITIDLTINSADVSITNSSPTLTANASGAIYQWLDCDNNFVQINNAISQTFLATTNGNYAVEVRQNGCTDTSFCINVSNANILENSFGNYLKAFPNPTQGEVKIELGANYNDVSVIVRNSVGKEVMRKSFNTTNSLEINIPGEAGIYWVEVSAQDKKALLKLIKELSD